MAKLGQATVSTAKGKAARFTARRGDGNALTLSGEGKASLGMIDATPSSRQSKADPNEAGTGRAKAKLTVAGQSNGRSWAKQGEATGIAGNGKGQHSNGRAWRDISAAQQMARIRSAQVRRGKA